MSSRDGNRYTEACMEQGADQGVGARIKRLREEREWSMAKLAVEADMSVSGVSMIENGKRNLTTTTLAKLARAFGVEVRDLFPLEQAPLPDFVDKRRPSVLADAVVAAADIWMREITTPGATWQTIYQAGEKVLDLQDFISSRLGEPGWWKGLSEQERYDVVHVDRYLDALATTAYRRQLELRERDTKQEAQREQFSRRREAIREQTRRISA
jgi:transcriptional regulator with XRE-family HTH domain